MKGSIAMKLKKIIPLISCALILAALIGVYVIVKNQNFEDEEQETKNESYSVISVSTDSIVSYKVTKADGTVWEFKKDNGIWKYEGDSNLTLNQQTVSEMVSAISKISASRYIEEGDTGNFGLDPAALQVEITTDDTATHSYKLGNVNSFNNTTYIMNLSDSKVYMFTDSVSEHFSCTLTELSVTDKPAETFDSNYLTSIELTDSDGRKNTILGDTASNALVTINDEIDCKQLVVYYAEEDSFSNHGIGKARIDFNYQEAVSVENTDGTTSTARVPATYSVIFGDVFSETDDNEKTTEYIYYTISKSTKIYKAPKTVHDKFMEYVDYTESDVDTDTNSDTSQSAPDGD